VFCEEGESYRAQIARERFFVPELKIKRVAGAFDQDEFVFHALADEGSG
jgi:hypothetical protein